jgi:hypothetical protein
MVRVSTIGLALVCATTLSGCVGWPFNNGRRAVAVEAPARVTTIGVNSYLYRASLDTLSFAPIVTSDPAGGVITTDWYANPSNPSERVRVSVAILDAALRADALRVTAARQTLQNGQWLDAPVAAATVQRMEEIILTRARDLRRAASIG